MKTIISRRRFGQLAATGLASAALPLRFARAAEFTFKVGTNVPDTHPLNKHLRTAAAEVLEKSGGRFELQIFPNNQLGADADMLSQLRSGALECFLNSGVNVLSTLVPNAAMSGVGFAFKDYPTLWNAMDGKVGAYLRTRIESGGLVVLEKIWDNGFRQITNSVRPIKTPSDLEGLKIRVPVSALWTSLFQSLGAAPTGLNFAEVYTALQTNVVDGQENPPAIISAAKLFEVQKYCSLSNHMWDGWWFLMNRRAWGQVPEDLQELVAQTLNANCLKQREDVAQKNVSLRADLAAAGLEFNEVDPGPFRERLSSSGFYAQWRKTFGEEAWAVLEESVGKLA